MAQARALAQLNVLQNQANADLQAQWEALQKKNAKGILGGSIGRLLGSVGAPLLMATGIGAPLSLGMTALSAGVGSRIGSEIGEHKGAKGGVQGGEAITSAGFGADKRAQIRSAADEAYGDYGQQQTMNALKDTFSAYTMAGGKMPGTFDKATGTTVGFGDVMTGLGEEGLNIGKILEGTSLWDKFSDEARLRLIGPLPNRGMPQTFQRPPSKRITTR